MSSPARIPQPRYDRRSPAGYHPDVPSDGLTLDTPHGPVDLVAVQRVLDRRPTPVSVADVRYAITQLPDGHTEHVEPLAVGLGITTDAVQRALERHKAATRKAGPQ